MRGNYFTLILDGNSTHALTIHPLWALQGDEVCTSPPDQRRYHGVMSRKRRVNLEIGQRHMDELEWLMDRWGLDRTNTLRVVISNAVREERAKDAQRAENDPR